MKTARFTEVVKAGGAPEPHLLWVPAEKDKTFQRAIKEHRIMTIHQEPRGTKKDYGTVGFHEEPSAQWLMFPKSLRRFEDRRIIGINYDLMAKPSPAQAAAAEKSAAKAAARNQKKVTMKLSTTDSKVVKFEPPAPEKPVEIREPPSSKRELSPAADEAKVKETTSEKPSKITKREPVRVPRIISGIEKAMKELKAGRTVLAYEQLESLVKGIKTSS